MSPIYYTHSAADYISLIAPYAQKNQHLFEQFKKDIKNQKHPVLLTPQDQQTLSEIAAYQKQFTHQFKTLVILGTGGSSLGARAIVQWLGFHNNPLLNACDFNFFATDNLDDISFSQLLEKIDLETTHFLVISKSGNTIETSVQLQSLLQHFRLKDRLASIAEKMTIITEVKADKNLLQQFAETYQIPVLKHSLLIGGRYSVLTMTGLLPAALLGIDYQRILQGAQSVIDMLLTADNFADVPPCQGAAALIASEEKSLLTHIFAAYGDRFNDFSNWIRQLWAESLGKGGKGGLFVPSLNPVDQHSQLQMYYDGVDNKTYSFMQCHLKQAKQTQLNFEATSAFSYLDGQTIHDVVQASYHGTIDSLRSRGRLVRTFSINDYSPEALGALMMHFIVETIFASYLLGINPYDQPAVEDYKMRTKAILKNT